MGRVATSGPKARRKKELNVRLLYSPQKVRNALAAHAKGMPLARCSIMFGVPRTTLWNKINGKAPTESYHPGPQSILGKTIEDNLVEYILTLARRGFPLDMNSVLDSVQKIVRALNLKTPFIDQRPGRKWWERFLSDHPQVSLKHAEHLTKARSLVSEYSIRNWFAEIDKDVADGGVDISSIVDPKRVWNCDETAMFLAPKGGLILGPKGESTYDVSAASAKDCITTLLMVNAAGEQSQPLVLYPYERLPGAISDQAPSGWGIGKSPNGWMTGENFYEYIANVFIPSVVDIEKPLLLYLDGHKSHITKHLSDLCVQSGIILIALPPNATAIMQPLDVSVFRPLKQGWKKTVKNWRVDHDGEDVNRFNFSQVLHRLFGQLDLKKAIQSGFRVTGLFPFNANNVDYTKCVAQKKTFVVENDIRQVISHLDHLESKMDPFLLQKFKEHSKQEDWLGEEKELYKIWKLFVVEDEANPVLIQHTDSQKPAASSTAITSCTLQDEEVSNPVLIKHTESQIPAASPTAITSYSLQEENVDNPVLIEHTESQIPAASSTVITSCSLQDKPSSSEVFQKVLFWPGTPKKKQVRKREKEPSVITSDVWKAYHMKKTAEKEEKESAKRKRAEERERKKKEREVLKLEKSRKVKKAVSRKLIWSSSEDEFEIPLESEFECESFSEDEDESQSPVKPETSGKADVGDYVTVQYNGGPYPGKVLEVKENGLIVSCYEKGMKCFRRPDKEDIGFYSWTEVVSKIKPPREGKRNQFCFEELDDFFK